MNIIRVVECSDHRTIYGYLKIENVSIDDVQNKIYEIKNSDEFTNEERENYICDWCIDDVFERFPKEWSWEYVTDNGNIVEI